MKLNVNKSVATLAALALALLLLPIGCTARVTVSASGSSGSASGSSSGSSSGGTVGTVRATGPSSGNGGTAGTVRATGPGGSNAGTVTGTGSGTGTGTGSTATEDACVRLDRAACLASTQCTLHHVEGTEYACRPASGQCEEGLVQTDQSACEARGCAFQPASCYCACVGNGHTAVEDDPHGERCSCVCGGGAPAMCAQAAVD